MATSRQIELFRKLTQDRDFSGHDVTELRTKFADLADRDASAWIEKALTREKVNEDGRKVAPPPF